MIKKSSQRLLLCLVAALMAPLTFVWAKGDYYTSKGLDALSDALDYSLNDPITTSSILAYLLTILAILSRRNNSMRSALIILAFLSAVDSLAKFAYLLLVENKYDLPTSLSYIFYRTPPLFPWQLLNTLGFVILAVVMKDEISWLKNQFANIFSRLKNAKSALTEFGNSALAIDRAAILGVLAILISSLTAGQGKWTQFKQAQDSFSSGFHVELVYIAIALSLSLIVTFFVASTVVGYLINTFFSWRQEFTDLSNNLTDFKLSRYVTRSISGYLYWIYSMAIVIALALVAPMQTVLIFNETRDNLGEGFHFELILILIVIPAICVVIGYLIVLLIRILFEVLIATIHIAQNTTTRTQLNKP